jgi:plasmid stability protein
VATLTIRAFDDELKRALRRRAAEHGRSMEAEVRAILRAVLRDQDRAGHGLGSRVHQRFADLGDVDLDLPPRAEPSRAAALPE